MCKDSLSFSESQKKQLSYRFNLAQERNIYRNLNLIFDAERRKHGKERIQHISN